MVRFRLHGASRSLLAPSFAGSSARICQVPPFLAYYGALTSNQTLLQMAYTQCSLYRDALVQSSGLWTHIALGTGAADPGVWATGNAWAAAGMLRVLATIQQSSFDGMMGSQKQDLQTWAENILGASEGYIVSICHSCHYRFMSAGTCSDDHS